MNLTTIGNMQAGLFTNWLVFNDPFTFLTAIIYFTCATAGVNRAPFDLAEAESELVAGFHTEYSGLRWSLFFMAEYSSMFVVSALASILFFGGSHGPIPVGQWIGETIGGTWGLSISRIIGVGSLLLVIPSLANCPSDDHVPEVLRPACSAWVYRSDDLAVSGFANRQFTGR